MKTNNYDTCSSMEDLELVCIRDGDMAREDFNHLFEVIEHSSYSKTLTLFFNGWEDNECPNYMEDCYDFTNCTYKDFREFCINYEVNHGLFSIKDTIENKINAFDTWKQNAEMLLEDIGLYEACRDGFPEINNAKLLYRVESVIGYSQGDYANVLIPVDCAVSRDYLENLVYNAPICCQLTIDGKEYYLDEHLENSYEYDKETMIKTIRETYNFSGVVMEWLEENLPKYPEYV